jgi:hypothetical protein
VIGIPLFAPPSMARPCGAALRLKAVKPLAILPSNFRAWGPPVAPKHKERQRRRGVLNPLFSTASLAYMEAWPLLNEAWLHSGSTQLRAGTFFTQAEGQKA